MYEWLCKLFVGHLHKWDTVKEVRVYNETWDGKTCADVIHLQCEICGKVKHTKINYGNV